MPLPTPQVGSRGKQVLQARFSSCLLLQLLMTLLMLRLLQTGFRQLGLFIPEGRLLC